MPKQATNDTALAAFIARKAEIDTAIERLRAASADHFFIEPDAVIARWSISSPSCSITTNKPFSLP